MTHGDRDRGGRHGDAGLAIGRDGLGPVLEFIDDAAREGPFFVWYAPFLPHTPHDPPERLLERYRDRAPSLHVARYWAMCELLDETCGELLGHLDARGLVDETVVLFLADNGWINRLDAPRYAPRSKRSPYEGGVRTPILLRWPGRVAPGRREAAASSIDLAPTVLRAAGLEPAPGMRGLDLTDAGALAAREAVFGDVYLHNAVDLEDPAANLTWRWCVAGDWKLIVPDPVNRPAEGVELYDLDADPGETANLAAAEPERVQELRGLLDAWWPGR